MVISKVLIEVEMFLFFFNDTATTEIYTLSLHDALPICRAPVGESLKFCAECEEEIPQARRDAVPGVKLCVEIGRAHV